MRKNSSASDGAALQAAEAGSWPDTGRGPMAAGPMDDLGGRIFREIRRQNSMTEGLIIGIVYGLGVLILLAGMA